MTPAAATPSMQNRCHLNKADAAWIPPPRDWLALYDNPDREALPYGLVTPTSDFIWRWMRAQPTPFTNTHELCSIRAGVTKRVVTTALDGLKRFGCVEKAPVIAEKDAIVWGAAGRGHNRQDRTTDYKDRKGGRAPTDWMAIKPQTSIARHLRDLHQQPTPPPPDGITDHYREIWDCLATHAIGAAAHISITEIARLLGLDERKARNRLATMRNKYRGAIQRLSCQTSVLRLRHIRSTTDMPPPDPLLHLTQKRCWICGETKPGTEFYRSRLSCSGIESKCRECSLRLVTYRRLAKWAGVSSSVMHHRAIADIREQHGLEIPQ